MKNKKIFLYIVFIFLFVLFLFMILSHSNLNKIKADVSGLSKNETFADAIQEVADAYVNKSRELSDGGITQNGNGGLIQYDSYLKKFNFSPEDAQKDRIQLTVCSNTIYQIYKEVFGISLPYDTKDFLEYAKYRSYDNGTYNMVNTDEVKYASSQYKEENEEYKRLLELEEKGSEKTSEELIEYNNLKSREEELFNNLVTYDSYGLSSARTIYNKSKNNGWLYQNSNGNYVFDTESTEAKNGFYDLFTNQYAPVDENGNKDLRVGDILVFRWMDEISLKDVSYGNETKKIAYPGSEAGHALMVYSIEEKNGAKDITLVEANNSTASVTNPGSDRKLADKTYVATGVTSYKSYVPTTHTMTNVINPLENYIISKSNFYSRAVHFLAAQDPEGDSSYLLRFTIIRPLEGKENQKIMSSDGTLNELDVDNEFLSGKTVTLATVDRLKYKGLEIFKDSTVDNESTETVMPGDTIKYTISFKNNSSSSYTISSIKETYDLKYVSVDASSLSELKTSGKATRAGAHSGEITIEGVTVPANGSIDISYSVIVKDKSMAKVGSKIVSTGSVGNIKNATVTKTVGYRLTTSTKQRLLAAINSVEKGGDNQSPNDAKTIGLKYIDDVLMQYYNSKVPESDKLTSLLFTDTNYSTKYLYYKNSSSNILKFENGKVEYNNQYYLKALSENSFTDYRNLFTEYHTAVSSNYPTEKKWYGMKYCSSDCLNISEYWLDATTKWDTNKVNYPVERNLSDGDVIWLIDKDKKDYIFMYLDGKLYSGYNSTMTIKKGKITLSSSGEKEELVLNLDYITNFDSNGQAGKLYDKVNKNGDVQLSVYYNLPRFLANLETCNAYAIFRPLSYIGLLEDSLEDEAYTITYDLNGGSANNSESYTINTETFTLNNPSKTGYTFTGWTGSNGSTKQTSVTITKGSIGNKSYTANYSEKTAKLTYNANGHGTAPSTVTMKYTTEVNAASAISADGYTFKKWCTNKNGSGTCYNAKAQVKAANVEPSAMTLYAIWTENENVDSLIESKLTMKSGRVILSVNSTTVDIINEIGSNNIDVLEGSTIIDGTQKIKTGNKLKTEMKEYPIVINGDTNSDGLVNIGDITSTYKYWKNKKTLTEEEQIAADANNDGTVNIGDLTRIYKISKGRAN